jgi:hypothetical protein
VRSLRYVSSVPTKAHVPTKARPHQGSDRRLFARDPSNVKPSAGSSHRDDCGRLVEDDPRRFGFHNLRHSLASFLVRIRTDPKTVQTLLRYGDFKLTLQFLQPRCQPGSHGRRGGNVNCDSQPRGGAAAGLFRDSLGPFGLFSTVRWSCIGRDGQTTTFRFVTPLSLLVTHA